MESGEEKGMSRRFSNVCMTLAFMGLFLFLGSSCAKKQVQVSEPPKAAPVQEVKKEAPAPVEDAAAKEAKLRAEKEKQLEKMRKAFEDESIYFDFDKYEIKADAKTTLQKKADFLAANTRYSLRIEGHCDERRWRAPMRMPGQRTAEMNSSSSISLDQINRLGDATETRSVILQQTSFGRPSPWSAFVSRRDRKDVVF